ncbi:hypothetical protein [Spirosoma aerophilum]
MSERRRQRAAIDPAYLERRRQAAKAYDDAHKEEKRLRTKAAYDRKPKKPRPPVSDKESKEKKNQRNRNYYQRMMAIQEKAEAERERCRRRVRSPLKSRIGWQLVRSRLIQRKADIRKREAIKKDPARLEVCRQKQQDRQRRHQASIRADPVKHAEFLQKRREYDRKRSAEKRKRMLEAIALNTPPTPDRKRSRRKKTPRANISVWLGSVNGK